jgi:hypothetical protein
MRNVLALLAVGFCVSSCVAYRPPQNFGEFVYLATEHLTKRSASVMNKEQPVLVSTIVDIDDIERSSSFGRLASQFISSRLVQRGYTVQDVTYIRALTLKPDTGELVLSRDAAQAGKAANAQAVVAGTFAVAGEYIWLNLRLLKADDGLILASVDVAVPLDSNTEPLVGAYATGGAFPPVHSSGR